MFRFRILIEFPALDRLIDYLLSRETAQQVIDAQTQRIKNMTARLKAAVQHEENQTNARS